MIRIMANDEARNAKSRRSPLNSTVPWRRLFFIGRGHWKRISVAGTLAVSGALVGLVFPLGLKKLLDSVLTNRNAAQLTVVAVWLLALLASRSALSALGGVLLKTTGERIVADLRARVYEHLQSLGVSYFASERIGDLSSRLTSDVAAVRTVVTDVIIAAILQSAKLVGALGVMLTLNWRLAVITLLSAPAATLTSKHFGRRVRFLSRDVQDGLAKASAVAHESLVSIRIVKAFTREPFEAQRYRKEVDGVFQKSCRVAYTGAVFGAVIEFISVLSLVALFWFGGREVIAGRLSAGDVIAFLFYSQTIAQCFSELTQVYSTTSAATGASVRIFELLDAMPDVVDASDARVLVNPYGEIRFNNVWFGYGNQRTVLRGVTLVASPGKTIALVGVSGAGKSTIVNLVLRFADPSQGTICIDGTDIRKLTIRSLRAHIALVPQEVQLFYGTIRENILYGRLSATEDEVHRAAADAYVNEFAMQLPDGLNTLVGEGGMTLSGGQRQRIAIARAFLRNAPIVLFDEATSAIDALGERFIQRAMERLRVGRTVLVVAHRLSTIEDADEICVVDGGEIVERGSHRRLVTAEGLYAELSGARAKHGDFQLSPQNAVALTM